MASLQLVSLRSVFLVLFLGGSIVWAYLPTMREVIGKWSNDPLYSHACLVPVFSAYLLWRSRKGISRRATDPVWVGVVPLLAGVLLRLLGAFFYVSWLEMISLLPILWGTMLLLGGWPLFRWSWAAIGFLAFMLPLPYRLESALSGPLQRAAVWMSTYALQTFGCPAYHEGNVIVLNDYRIGVVEACNGLGMLILFFALAAGVAILIHRPWPDRVALVASAVPIAVLANTMRILTTSMLYQAAGQAWGDFLFHDLAGWLMMPLALGMLWLELKLTSWLLIEAPEEEDTPLLNLSRSVESELQHAQV